MEFLSRIAFGRRNEDGATAVEYGLLVALIAGVIISIVAILGGQILAVFTDATTWPWN